MISSLQPKVGRTFSHVEFENRKLKLLEDTRKNLIRIAIEEKDKELCQTNEQFSIMKQAYIDANQNHNEFLNKMEKLMNAQAHRLNNSMNKKVTFHLSNAQPPIEFVKKKAQVKKKRK